MVSSIVLQIVGYQPSVLDCVYTHCLPFKRLLMHRPYIEEHCFCIAYVKKLVCSGLKKILSEQLLETLAIGSNNPVGSGEQEEVKHCGYEVKLFI